MTTPTNSVEEFANKEYKYGFVTDIETEAFPKGLNEDIVRMIDRKSVVEGQSVDLGGRRIN